MDAKELMTSWNPIDTAPKDGSFVLLRDSKQVMLMPFWWSKRKRRWETYILAPCRKSKAWWDENAPPPIEWKSLTIELAKDSQ